MALFHKKFVFLLMVYSEFSLMSHEVPLILDHFFAHVLWTAIFQIFENSPLLVVESFSTYYGEVPLQKNGLNVKFNLYYTATVGAILILHRER